MVQTKRYAGLTAANTKKVAMAAPMFSIIIPTLNVAAVLPACLDSIARQTCGDFELVLVDAARRTKPSTSPTFSPPTSASG